MVTDNMVDLWVSSQYNKIKKAISGGVNLKEYKDQIEPYVPWEELEICNDFLFGKIMQEAELCRELLQRILPELEIDHIEYPELQKTIKADVDAKSVRLDVYVRDDKNTVYDIEMQVVNTGELPKRTRFYQSMLDLQLLDKGQTSQTSHIKNGIRTLKNQYFSPQNILMLLLLSALNHLDCFCYQDAADYFAKRCPSLKEYSVKEATK